MTGLASELLSAARTRSSLLAAKGRISALSTLTWDDGEQFVLGKGEYAKQLHELIKMAAAQDVSVMITGETGTGKEMVARALHRMSPRREGPFVAVNCAALPREIIEAELFGAEKGAFTGATERRIGRFEIASSGTLFLDEIGELPLDVQVKLLRSLQERTINSPWWQSSNRCGLSPRLCHECKYRRSRTRWKFPSGFLLSSKCLSSSSRAS